MNENCYYPVFFNIRGSNCLIVGGGNVAERKIIPLISLGALVTVVSPDITSVIKNFFEQKKITWICSKYQKKYLENMHLIISATNDKDINSNVFKDAQAKGIPINCVDDIEHCSFIVPASIQKGNIQIAVSTGGGAPAVAAMIKRSIDSIIEPEWEILVDILKKNRQRIIAIDSINKKIFWQKIQAIDIAQYKGKKNELLAEIETLIKTIEKK